MASTIPLRASLLRISPVVAKEGFIRYRSKVRPVCVLARGWHCLHGGRSRAEGQPSRNFCLSIKSQCPSSGVQRGPGTGISTIFCTVLSCSLFFSSLYCPPAHAENAALPSEYFLHQCTSIDGTKPENDAAATEATPAKGTWQEKNIWMGRIAALFENLYFENGLYVSQKAFIAGDKQTDCEVPLAFSRTKDSRLHEKQANRYWMEHRSQRDGGADSFLAPEAEERVALLDSYGKLLQELRQEEEGCLECVRHRRLLEQVWQTVANWYYDPKASFSEKKWAEALTNSLQSVQGSLRSRPDVYRAAREMVASLGDRYSLFLSPAQFRIASRRTQLPQEVEYLAAQYTGVGMELRQRSIFGGFTIEAPFAGSPAEEAGIRGGERLIAIDGFLVDYFTVDEAVVLLRGPVGSKVTLTIASHSGRDAPQRIVAVERRSLPVPPVRTRMVEGEASWAAGMKAQPISISYIRVHYFNRRTARLVAAAIREGEVLGVDGYVLDLRNNPGGLFEEAIRTAGLLIDCTSCDLVATVTKYSEREELIYSNVRLKEIFPNHPGPLTRVPLVVIANRNTASASEVFVGALHDNRRAVFVGEQTFGKGVIQQFFPLDDGSAVRLTVAKYLTPTRYDISKRGGILPDVMCSDYPRAQGDDACIVMALEAIGQLCSQQ